MLVLSRRKAESIRIEAAGGIEIHIVGIGRGKVRLAIDAPSNVAVHRREYWERTKRNRPRDYGPTFRGPEVNG